MLRSIHTRKIDRSGSLSQAIHFLKARTSDFDDLYIGFTADVIFEIPDELLVEVDHLLAYIGSTRDEYVQRLIEDDLASGVTEANAAS